MDGLRILVLLLPIGGGCATSVRTSGVARTSYIPFNEAGYLEAVTAEGIARDAFYQFRLPTGESTFKEIRAVLNEAADSAPFSTRDVRLRMDLGNAIVLVDRYGAVRDAGKDKRLSEDALTRLSRIFVARLGVWEPPGPLEDVQVTATMGILPVTDKDGSRLLLNLNLRNSREHSVRVGAAALFDGCVVRGQGIGIVDISGHAVLPKEGTLASSASSPDDTYFDIAPGEFFAVQNVNLAPAFKWQSSEVFYAWFSIEATDGPVALKVRTATHVIRGFDERAESAAIGGGPGRAAIVRVDGGRVLRCGDNP